MDQNIIEKSYTYGGWIKAGFDANDYVEYKSQRARYLEGLELIALKKEKEVKEYKKLFKFYALESAIVAIATIIFLISVFGNTEAQRSLFGLYLTLILVLINSFSNASDMYYKIYDLKNN